MPNRLNNQPPITAPTIPRAMSRKNPSPLLLTSLLPMKPAIRPSTIHAMIDMVCPPGLVQVVSLFVGSRTGAVPARVRLQPPPHRTAQTDFPYAALLSASRHGLCDLSTRSAFGRSPIADSVVSEEPEPFMEPRRTPPLPAEAVIRLVSLRHDVDPPPQVLQTNLDNSRRMKEKSHRAPQGCDKSGDKTLPHSTTRRLDGYRLYSASHVRIRSEKEAGGRSLRLGARQLRRRRDLAQGDRYPARADQGLGRVPRRSAAAGQGPASDARAVPATGLWARLWLRRLQRRRPAGRRRDPQTVGRPRSDRGAGPGLAAHALAVRECRGVARAAEDGARAGRDGHRAPSAATPGSGPPYHDRPRSHRRSYPWAAGVHLLQRPLRHLVLSAGGGHGDVRRRGRAVCRRRRPAPRQRAGQPRGLWAFAAPDSAIARGVSRAHDPGAPGWGLRHPHDVRVPRGPGGRVRRGHGEQRPVGEAGPALDGPGPDALPGDRPDRASLRGDALRRQDVEAPAPRDHQGRGRPASGPRPQEQSPVRRDQPPRRAPDHLRADLLPTGRRGEPAQGAASRAGAGPDQLLTLSGQPVPRPAHAGRVPAVPGAPTARPRHRVRGRASHHAARTADQARRVGGVLGAPHRPALADELPLAPDVAPARPRGRRDHLRPSGKLARRVTAGSVSRSAAPVASAPTRRWALRPYRSRRRAEIDSSLRDRVPMTRWGLAAILDVHVHE